MPSITIAQAAVWTPPQGQSNGKPIPNTIFNPFTKTAIPDTDDSRFCIALSAGTSLLHQGLFAGIVGTSREQSTPLMLSERRALCVQLFQEGENITAYMDLDAVDPYRAFFSAKAAGMKVLPFVDPTQTDPTKAAVGGGFQCTDLSPMAWPLQQWAINALTPATPVGVTNPIGAWQGLGVEGQVGSNYANAPGSTYTFAQLGVSYTDPNSGAMYVLAQEGVAGGMLGTQAVPGVEWIMLRPASN
jgi:hypothetical protein